MTPRPSSPIAAIQALRAFAVSWVVLDHAFPWLLPGGFVGVDIFFVISGHLITAHLIGELARGEFTFARFYLRRARRLLPAALSVLILTLIGTLWLLPPAWTAETLGGIGAAAIYGVNWWLAAHAVDYFADSGVISPVNHFWSLSVEEQFYLVWPALLWAGWRLFGRRGAPALRRTVAALLTGVFALSLLAATLATRHDPGPAYFLTYTRAWEFALGGLSALAVPRLARTRGGWTRTRALSVLFGWAVLVASGWLLSPRSGVPGPVTLPVVLATAWLLIIGDGHGARPLHRVIAWAPVQRLGDISYSVYLWHWPLLILAPFALGVEALSVVQRLALLGATLILSALSWRFIETRFRSPGAAPHRAGTTGRRLAAFVALSLALAGLAFGLARHQSGKSAEVATRLFALSQDPAPCFGARASEPGADCPASHRLADPDFALQTWASQIIALPNGTSCQSEPGEATLARCAFGAPPETATRRVALLGDSHAGMWASALGQFVATDGIRVETFLASSCPTTDAPDVFATYLAPENRAACLSLRAEATGIILNDPAIDTVIVSGNAYQLKRWTEAGWVEDDGAGLARVWARFIAAGKRVLVIDDVPMLPWKLPDCLARPGQDAEACTHPAAEVPPETPLARAFRRLGSDRARLISFKDVFCDATTCHSIIGGIPAYMDSDHISAPLSRSLAPRLRAALSETR